MTMTLSSAILLGAASADVGYYPGTQCQLSNAVPGKYTKMGQGANLEPQVLFNGSSDYNTTNIPTDGTKVLFQCPDANNGFNLRPNLLNMGVSSQYIDAFLMTNWQGGSTIGGDAVEMECVDGSMMLSPQSGSYMSWISWGNAATYISAACYGGIDPYTPGGQGRECSLPANSGGTYIPSNPGRTSLAASIPDRAATELYCPGHAYPTLQISCNDGTLSPSNWDILQACSGYTPYPTGSQCEIPAPFNMIDFSIFTDPSNTTSRYPVQFQVGGSAYTSRSIANWQQFTITCDYGVHQGGSIQDKLSDPIGGSSKTGRCENGTLKMDNGLGDITLGGPSYQCYNPNSDGPVFVYM